MDVQKTMEFILEQQSHFYAMMDQMRERHAEAEKRQAEAEKGQGEAQKQHNREMAQIRNMLRHAVKLSVREARRERELRRELDARLSAAHQITEEKLQRFIDSLNRPRTNGHPTDP